MRKGGLLGNSTVALVRQCRLDANVDGDLSSLRFTISNQWAVASILSTQRAKSRCKLGASGSSPIPHSVAAAARLSGLKP
jgi:hypothetical protein